MNGARQTHIAMPDKVKEIIRTLRGAGFEAWAVGGCVRDSILGRAPGDWDITTSALPEQTKELFPRTFDTGIQHGTVTVLLEGEGFEVTTYRIDGAYEDSRHPKEVTFTRNLKDDLLRRDFVRRDLTFRAGRTCGAGILPSTPWPTATRRGWWTSSAAWRTWSGA